MDPITSRPYLPDDSVACLALFDSNTPQYFAPQERAEFAAFLAQAGGKALPYLVLEQGGVVVACGGVELRGDHAGLTWGMVARARHGQGLGRALTLARLDRLRAMPEVGAVVIETSQHTRGFYEGFGFVVTAIVPDGFGPGLDRCDMRLDFPAGPVAGDPVQDPQAS